MVLCSSNGNLFNLRFKKNPQIKPSSFEVHRDSYPHSIRCEKLSKYSFVVNANDPYFHHKLWGSHNAYLVQMWFWGAKCITRYRTDKTKCLECWAKMAKMTLNFKVNDHIFNTSRK